MIPKAKIRRATIEDAHEMAPLLRLADRQEVEAYGVSPLDSLVVGVRETEAYSVVWSDQVVAIYGISPHPLVPEYGVVWLLGTPEIEKIRLQFLRECRKILKTLSKSYECVGNFVDSRNTLHHRWLHWMGFQAVNTMDINGVPFYQFLKVKHDV